MTIDDSDSALQIVEAGRVRVLARLRDAVDEQLRARPELGTIEPATTEALVEEAFAEAGAALWRISLAEGAADLYGVAVRDALGDPAVAAAERLVGVDPESAPDDSEPWADDESQPWESAPEPTTVAPAAEPVAAPAPPPPAPETQPTAVVPAPTPQVAALRLPVVHRGGIDSLKNNDKDIELRLSDDGLDVLKRSSGAALGRLDWSMITAIEVAQPKRGRRKRKAQFLQIHTAGGEATFELSELTPEQINSELEPTLARLRSAGLI